MLAVHCKIDNEVESALTYFCNPDFAPLGWFTQANQVRVYITAIWVQVATGTEEQCLEKTHKQRKSKEETCVCVCPNQPSLNPSMSAW